jgi:hypothetical protein
MRMPVCATSWRPGLLWRPACRCVCRGGCADKVCERAGMLCVSMGKRESEGEAADGAACTCRGLLHRVVL